MKISCHWPWKLIIYLCWCLICDIIGFDEEIVIMGITGLLPFLEKATRNCNISEFRGSTVAIDSYCWLHKGATACADVLARGEETDV